MQGEAKIIQSPFSGEYIRPRITTREDEQNVYTEAVYICPSSGNFVQKVVINTQPKKKVVNEAVVEEGLGALKGVADTVLKYLPYYNVAMMAKNAAGALIPKGDDECDPETGEGCEQMEEEDTTDEEVVLDYRDGHSFKSVLEGIQAKCEEVQENKDDALLTRNGLVDIILDIKEDIEQCLKNLKHGSEKGEDEE